MFDQITRYVLRQLVVGMVLVSLALTAIIWLSQSLRFVELIVSRGLTAGQFFHLTILLLPSFLALILPVALFAVVVFTYSKLANDRELIVMRSAGIGQMAMAKPALMLAVVVVALGYWLNVHVLPTTYQMFRELQWDIRYNYSQVLIQEGTFNAISKGITVYVRERGKNGELQGILIDDARDPDRVSTLMAARGAMTEVGDVARVIMFDGNRQEIDKAANRMSILYFDRYTFDLDARPRDNTLRNREARELSQTELMRLTPEDLGNRLDYGKFAVERHRRVIAPALALGYALVGVACMISGFMGQRTQTRRVIAATAFFVVFQVAQLGIEAASAKRIELITLLYLNAALPFVTGLAILFQPRWLRRIPGFAAGRLRRA